MHGIYKKIGKIQKTFCFQEWAFYHYSGAKIYRDDIIYFAPKEHIYNNQQKSFLSFTELYAVRGKLKEAMDIAKHIDIKGYSNELLFCMSEK